ncbi:MAG: hypothetical protein ABI882_19670, partial [Acidobacteriota bacterium]
LGGVKVTFNGTDAELLIVTPNQINLIIPANIPLGPAIGIVTNSDGTTLSGPVTIVQSKPGVFTATSDGKGVLAAQTTFDAVTYQFTSNPDGSAKPIDPGTAQSPNFLILYVTGLGIVQTSQVTVTILGVPARVDYAGPQCCFPGLDQINVRIPWELGGLGLATLRVKITIGNVVQDSNPVTINLGGQIPPILAFPLTPGQVVNGALTYEDQIQTSGDSVYFFDSYIFETTAANVSVAIDLRSPKTGAAPGEAAFDPLLLLYRLDANQLSLVAANDQTGGIGDGDIDVNDNALLLTVLAQPGTYVLLATTSDFNALGVGSYTLTFKENVIQQLTYGQSVNGNITATSVQTSAGVYLNSYWFNATIGDRIEVIMRSTAFDSFLFLYRNYTDPEIAFDDNTGGGQDAKLVFRITETGKHLIFATPFKVNTTGAYTLSLNKLASLAPEEEATSGQPASFPSRIRTVENPRRLNSAYRQQSSSFDRAALRRFVVR